MDDLVTWLRLALDEAESDVQSYLELRPDDPDWASLALAEVVAKRRILDRCELVLTANEHTDRDADGISVTNPIARRLARDTVRLLALPCDDRPGYREAWRP